MTSLKLYYVGCLVLFVSFVNLPLSFCYEEDDNESFLTPEVLNDRKEAFILENKKYILSNIHVTFEEAKIVCASYAEGAKLAILDTMEKAYFIATALSETSLAFDNLWIGAVLEEENKKKQFRWIDGRIVNYKRLRGKNESHWVVRGKDLSASLISSRKCLAFARKFHMQPHYVDLNCNLLRPFICETDAVVSGVISPESPVDLNGNRYTLYHGEVSWHEAVAHCREQKQQLATFLDIETIKKFGRIMLTARPSVEVAWIGGFFDNQISEWKWLPTSEIINGTENKETQFPPWRPDVKTRKQSGCLLFDRHLAKNPVFLEARCERKRSFICEESIKEKKKAFALTGQKSTYIIFFLKKTWQSAKKECDKHNWQLVTATETKLDDIVTLMGENFTEIQHIWIGAKLNKEGTNFVWAYDNKPLPSAKNSKSDGSVISYYPPLIDRTFSKTQKCLNMDRENHVDILWYGLACNHTQYFICETSDKTVSTKSILFEEDEETTSGDPSEDKKTDHSDGKHTPSEEEKDKEIENDGSEDKEKKNDTSEKKEKENDASEETNKEEDTTEDKDKENNASEDKDKENDASEEKEKESDTSEEKGKEMDATKKKDKQNVASEEHDEDKEMDATVEKDKQNNASEEKDNENDASEEKKKENDASEENEKENDASKENEKENDASEKKENDASEENENAPESPKN